jgi:outer membrane protein assembly factor BamB
MKRLIVLATIVSIVGVLLMLQYSVTETGSQASADPKSDAKEKRTPGEPSSTHVLDAVKISVPQSSALEPVAFKTPDGKRGWRVAIPGSRTLATPAIANGKIFIGGGFGSHEFYAIDAATGKKVWQYQTKDDGPTAAVVQDGYIAFNTESCELEILTLDGKPVWKKWLGDPLMSMPAMANGKVYMAYPDSLGSRQHYIACFDVKTGKECWKQPIAGEIITAPVIEDNHVYLAALEGSVYCFSANDGQLVWSEKKNATSSPMVWNKQCYFSRREEVTLAQAGKQSTQQTELLASRGSLAAHGTVASLKHTANQQADYLDSVKKQELPSEKMKQAADASVGFGGVVSSAGAGTGIGTGIGVGKGDSKLDQAYINLGEKTVSGVWSYQGSKPFVSNGKLYSAMGDTLKCVDPKSEKVLWQKTFQKKDKSALVDRTLTPPVLVNNKIFLCSVFGDVLCLSATSGKVLWSVNVGEPIVFQPAVANGKVYVSTQSGSLYAIETGDTKDDGWLMWGAKAAHNGLVK